VEALDLAAGLRVVRRRVLEDNAQRFQLGLQQNLALARGAGEDGAVVGEQRGGKTVFLGGGVEDLDDVGALDGGEGNAGKQQAGVVVEVVEDLDVTAVGEAPVGWCRPATSRWATLPRSG